MLYPGRGKGGYNVVKIGFFSMDYMHVSMLNYVSSYLLMSARELCLPGGTILKTNEIVKNICSCHNFFPLSSVQIIIIPACCLLCVL